MFGLQRVLAIYMFDESSELLVSFTYLIIAEAWDVRPKNDTNKDLHKLMQNAEQGTTQIFIFEFPVFSLSDRKFSLFQFK